MLLKLEKYLRGYVKISVTGYSPERFLNLCNVQHLLLWGVENKGLTYELYLRAKDYKKLRPLAKKTRTKICLLEKHGLPFFMHRFRKRKMFFGGMFCCVILIYLLSLFIWNIHIEGNVTQSTEEILSCLENLQIRHGTAKSKISCETIETELRSQYPNILWVSAEMRGTRILIQIKENTDQDIVSKIEEKMTEPVSIISETDGIVRSILVRQGTPKVSAGDQIVKDQILVEGYYEVKDDNGEIIRYQGVLADADIFIESRENYEDRFSLEYKKRQYTGKKRLGVKMTFLEKEKLILPKIPYESYETVKRKQEIHVTENFYLPFSVELYWFLEYEEVTFQYTEKEVKTLAEQRFQKKYENILQKGVQIIEKDVRIVTNGKLCRVSGTVDLLIPVTAKIPAVIPEIDRSTSEEGEDSI